MSNSKRNIKHLGFFVILFLVAGLGQGQAAQMTQPALLTNSGTQITTQVKPKKKKVKKKTVKSAKKKIKKAKAKSHSKKTKTVKKVKTTQMKTAKNVKSGVKKSKKIKRINSNKITTNKSKIKTKVTGSKRKNIKKSTRQCAAITQDGMRCKRLAAPGSKYCWQHKNYRKK